MRRREMSVGIISAVILTIILSFFGNARVQAADSEFSVTLGRTVYSTTDVNYFSFPDAVVYGSDTISSMMVSVDKGEMLKSTLSGAIVDYKNTAATWLFSTTKTATEVQAMIRNIVFVDDGTDGTMNIRFDLDSHKSNLPANSIMTIYTPVQEYIPGQANTPHYYVYIPFNGNGGYLSWYQAYNKAKEMTFQGLRGYLVTVTELGEDQVLDKINQTEAWGGGARLDNNFNKDYFDAQTWQGNTSAPTAASSSWFWACGPEAGEFINNTNGTDKNGGVNNYGANKSTKYPYFNWNNGEPNNSTNEWCMEVHFGDNPVHKPETSKGWNDYTAVNTSIVGFFVEFSEYPGGYATTDGMKPTAGTIISDGNGETISASAEITRETETTADPSTGEITIKKTLKDDDETIKEEIIAKLNAEIETGEDVEEEKEYVDVTIEDGDGNPKTGEEYSLTYEGVSPTVYGPSTVKPTACGTYRVTLLYNGETLTWEYTIEEVTDDSGETPTTSTKITGADSVIKFRFYDSDGLAEICDPVSVSGTSFSRENLPACTMTKEGFTFDGWCEDKEGRKPAPEVITKSTDFYASWLEYPTVYFMTYGGTLAVESYKSGMATISGSDINGYTPTKANYVFGGWYFDDEFKNKVEDASQISRTSSVFAKWYKENIKISFVTDCSTVYDQLNIVPPVSGLSIINNYPLSKENYTFDGWYASDTFAEAGKLTEELSIENDITLYAKWLAHPHITVDTAGCATMDAFYADTPVITGSAILERLSELNMEKEGYTFMGWYLNNTSGSPLTEETQITEDTRICAKFNHDLIIKAKGQSVPSLTYTVPFDEAISGEEINSFIPSRNGYEFGGWYKEDTFINRILDTDEFRATESVYSYNVYAKWNEIFEVEFILDGGSLSGQPAPASEISGQTINQYVPEKSGYTFEGWYKDEKLKNPLADDDVLTFETGIKVYARWTPNPVITFVTDEQDEENGKTTYIADTENITGLELINAFTPEKAGYSFERWEYDNEGEREPVDENDIISADITVYAKWTKIENKPVPIIIVPEPKEPENPAPEEPAKEETETEEEEKTDEDTEGDEETADGEDEEGEEGEEDTDGDEEDIEKSDGKEGEEDTEGDDEDIEKSDGEEGEEDADGDEEDIEEDEDGECSESIEIDDPIYGDVEIEVDEELGVAALPDMGEEPETPEAQDDVLTYDFTDVGVDINGADIPVETFEKLQTIVNEEDTPGKYIQYRFATGYVTIDNNAATAILDQAEGDYIRLVVLETAPKELSEIQMEAIENLNPEYTFEAYFESNGERIHDFKGGEVEVSIRFEPEDDKDIYHYHVCYVSEEGELEYYVTRYENGMLYYTTTHFSDFAILYDLSRENATKKQTDSDARLPQTGVASSVIWYGIGALMMLCGGGILFSSRRKR